MLCTQSVYRKGTRKMCMYGLPLWYMTLIKTSNTNVYDVRVHNKDLIPTQCIRCTGVNLS